MLVLNHINQCFGQGDAPRAISLKEGLEQDHVTLCFADPWTEEANPGWPLRNILSLVAHHAPEKLKDFKVGLILLFISIFLRKNTVDSSFSVLYYIGDWFEGTRSFLQRRL